MVWNYICVRVLSVCHLLWIHTQSEAGNHPPLRKCFKNWQIHHPYFPQTSSRIEVPECRHQCPRTSNFPHTSPDPVRVGILWLQMGRVGPGTLFELHIATIISKFLENYKTCQGHAMPCHATPHLPPPLLVPPEGSGTKAFWPECAQALKSKDPLGPQLSLAVGIFPVQQAVPVGHGQTLSRLISAWRRVIRTIQGKTQRSTLDFSILICLLIFWKGKKQEGVLWAQKNKMLVIFLDVISFFGVHNFWVLKACEWPTMPAIWVLVCFDWIVSRIACTIGISLPFACFNGYKTQKKILILHDRKTPHVNFFQQVTQERWRRNGKGRKETWDGESYVWKTCVW